MCTYLSSPNQNYDLLLLKVFYWRLQGEKLCLPAVLWSTFVETTGPRERGPFLGERKYVISALLTYHINCQLQKRLLKLLAYLPIFSKAGSSIARENFHSEGQCSPAYNGLEQRFSMQGRSPVKRQSPTGRMFIESRLECTKRNYYLDCNIEWTPFYVWPSLYT